MNDKNGRSYNHVNDKNSQSLRNDMVEVIIMWRLKTRSDTSDRGFM